MLQTVILYGDKTNYFREVNEFIKKKNHYSAQNDNLMAKVTVLTKLVNLLRGKQPNNQKEN